MYIHVRVYLLHAYMRSGNFARGRGPDPIFSRGFQLFSGWGGGVQLLFYKETCEFSRVGGPDLLPHVSLYKAFKM